MALRMTMAFGAVLMAMGAAGCDAASAGGCDARSIDGTCRDWYAPSAELETRRAEAMDTCASLGATYQQTSFTCSSSSKVGSCVLDTAIDGPRIFYYDPSYTAESARSDCDTRGGGFLE